MFKDVVPHFEDWSRSQLDPGFEFWLPAHVEAGGDLATEHQVFAA
jgi:hypothetical protein